MMSQECGMGISMRLVVKKVNLKKWLFANQQDLFHKLNKRLNRFKTKTKPGRNPNVKHQHHYHYLR